MPLDPTYQNLIPWKRNSVTLICDINLKGVFPRINGDVAGEYLREYLIGWTQATSVPSDCDVTSIVKGKV